MKTCSICWILACVFVAVVLRTEGSFIKRLFAHAFSSSLAFAFFFFFSTVNFSFPLIDQCNFSDSLDRRLTVFASMELMVSSLGIGFYKQIEKLTRVRTLHKFTASQTIMWLSPFQYCQEFLLLVSTAIKAGALHIFGSKDKDGSQESYHLIKHAVSCHLRKYLRVESELAIENGTSVRSRHSSSIHQPSIQKLSYPSCEKCPGHRPLPSTTCLLLHTIKMLYLDLWPYSSISLVSLSLQVKVRSNFYPSIALALRLLHIARQPNDALHSS
jgi:hypothetical protein